VAAFDVLRLLVAGGVIWFHDSGAAVYIAFFGSVEELVAYRCEHDWIDLHYNLADR
jgi:hypothetical protein